MIIISWVKKWCHKKHYFIILKWKSKFIVRQTCCLIFIVNFILKSAIWIHLWAWDIHKRTICIINRDIIKTVEVMRKCKLNSNIPHIQNMNECKSTDLHAYCKRCSCQIHSLYFKLLCTEDIVSWIKHLRPI